MVDILYSMCNKYVSVSQFQTNGQVVEELINLESDSKWLDTKHSMNYSYLH